MDSGESPENPENYVHHYKLYCLNKNDGQVIWVKTAYSGIPQVKRHIKSSHANSSPATDGNHVIAFFGSEGLYCYDMDGRLLWKKDLGYLDAGAFDAPDIQWGFGSSPIIDNDKVIVLCDVNNQSFITALDIKNGREIWRTLRDEVPTWGTPTLVDVNGTPQLIVNGWKHIGSYDAETGKEIWWMKGGGDVPVPTPIIAHGLTFITNSHGRMRPIYAVRLNARGDITLKNGETANEFVAWFDPRRGTYMSTPLVYDEYIYFLNMNGVLTCYLAKTGEQVYRERTAGQHSAYSASPVCVDGKLYITSEYGDIHVIKAGPVYEHLASNSMGEICMATPAISGNMLFIRTNKSLYAIKDRGTPVKKLAQKSHRKTHPDQVAVTKKTEQFVRPDKELTDPVEILKLVDAAAKAVETIKYHVSVEGTEGLKDRIGVGKAAIIATGYLDGLPEKFLMEGEYQAPGSAEILKFIGGSDGNEYYLIDHNTQTVHSDLMLGIMGSLGQVVYGGLVREFHLPEPFTEEVNSDNPELLGTKTIGGEDCYEIKVVYSVEQNNKAIWYFSKKDFLPRRRIDFYTLQDGQKGTVIKTLTNLVVEPRLAPNTFNLQLPDGYKKTDQAHP